MKLINDTLKNPQGVWSLKRIMALGVLVLDLILGIFIVISDKILKTPINIYAIEVFNGLLLFVATAIGITEFGKKFLNKKEENQDSQ